MTYYLVRAEDPISGQYEKRLCSDKQLTRYMRVMRQIGFKVTWDELSCI